MNEAEINPAIKWINKNLLLLSTLDPSDPEQDFQRAVLRGHIVRVMDVICKNLYRDPERVFQRLFEIRPIPGLDE